MLLEVLLLLLAVSGMQLDRVDADRSRAGKGFEKWNRLNYYYYVRDDAGMHGGSVKDSFVVRLGLAHFWQYLDFKPNLL